MVKDTTGEHPLAVAASWFGLPNPDEIIPPPSEVAEMIGIPTPAELVKGLRSKAPLKLPGLR